MRNPDLSCLIRSHPTQLFSLSNQPMKYNIIISSGSEAGKDYFNNKESKQSTTMTDRNRHGNAVASGPDTNTIVHDPKPPPRRNFESRFKEHFSSDDELTTANKPVRMPLPPAETLDRNGSAMTAPSLSVTESNNASSSTSTASTYTGYEKPMPMQPVMQKGSSDKNEKNEKVSVLPPPN